MELEALDHVGLTVADVSRSVDWYGNVGTRRRRMIHFGMWVFARRGQG